jgi:DNA repair protein RadC
MADLAPDNRPREKLERNGLTALADNELLALVLGRGTAGQSAVAVASRVLAEVGGTHGLVRASRSRLRRVAGIGGVLAGRIQAAVELGRRTLTRSPQARLRFQHPAQAAAFLVPRFGAHPVERFGALLLDARHRLITVQLISVGTTDGTTALPREVFREATVAGAIRLIAFHNHPSGDATPSEADRDLTVRLVRAGALLGITVIDHIILADTQYFTFRNFDYF